MRSAVRPALHFAHITALALVVAATSPFHTRLHAQVAAAATDSIVAPRDTASAANVAAPADESAPAARSGAPMTGLRSGVHAPETARAFQPNAAATNPHLGQARAMMVVGAAALITGAIIGGDAGTIFMVGGAIVGLYGLYQYLQ